MSEDKKPDLVLIEEYKQSAELADALNTASQEFIRTSGMGMVAIVLAKSDEKGDVKMGILFPKHIEKDASFALQVLQDMEYMMPKWKKKFVS